MGICGLIHRCSLAAGFRHLDAQLNRPSRRAEMRIKMFAVILRYKQQPRAYVRYQTKRGMSGTGQEAWYRGPLDQLIGVKRATLQAATCGKNTNRSLR